MIRIDGTTSTTRTGMRTTNKNRGVEVATRGGGGVVVAAVVWCGRTLRFYRKWAREST